VRVVLFTEDSGSKGFEVARAVLQQALRQASLGAEAIEPGPPELKPIVSANGWKSPRHKDGVRLRRQVATYLLEDRLVVFHVDGDRTWRDREGSENVRKFREMIYERVEQILREHPRPRAGHRDTLAVPGAERGTTAIARLIGMHPFWSIEAWLYAAIPRLEPVDLEKTSAEWRAAIISRNEFDELVQPKDMPGGPGDTLNVALSREFKGQPTAKLLAAGKSYAAFVQSLTEACAPENSDGGDPQGFGPPTAS
jgi:hypothetical protein